MHTYHVLLFIDAAVVHPGEAVISMGPHPHTDRGKHCMTSEDITPERMISEHRVRLSAINAVELLMLEWRDFCQVPVYQ
jgi:hypothetical protein